MKSMIDDSLEVLYESYPNLSRPRLHVNPKYSNNIKAIWENDNYYLELDFKEASGYSFSGFDKTNEENFYDFFGFDKPNNLDLTCSSLRFSIQKEFSND
jgi:hypothetical protein